MFRDPGFAVRNLSKHLWLSLAVAVTLGVFSFIDAQILRPQSDKDFDSFAQIYSAYTRDPLRPFGKYNPQKTLPISNRQLAIGRIGNGDKQSEIRNWKSAIGNVT